MLLWIGKDWQGNKNVFLCHWLNSTIEEPVMWAGTLFSCGLFYVGF